jgi:phage terminase large subunit-like protein
VLFNLASKMIRMSAVLSEYVQIKDSAKKLVCPGRGTVFQALSADASTAFGLSPDVLVHDELGQVRGPRSDLYEALESACAAKAAPLSVVISTQAPGDDDLLSVLIDDAAAGHDPRTVLRIQTADPDADPFDPDTIRQANPAFDVFQNQDEILAEAENARRMPSREAGFRNLILNQRVEANDPYVSQGVWKANGGEPSDLRGVESVAALDLSASQDLTAYVRVAWRDNAMHVVPRFWLPENGLAEKSRVDHVPYDVWKRQGFLQTTPGATIDYEFVAHFVLDELRSGVTRLAYDRWQMRFLKRDLERLGATEAELARLMEFGQGFKDMSPALKVLDGLLLNNRMRHGNHPVLTMCATNAVVKSDPAGNRKLVKLQSNRRIDGMVALAMAVATAGEPEAAEAGSYIARRPIVMV